MTIKLKREEAIIIIQYYYLLNIDIEQRGNILVANGEEVVDKDDNWLVNEIYKVENNSIIRNNYFFSKLVRDEYLEFLIEKFYKSKVKIISNEKLNIEELHSCVCCGYKISFKRNFHNICPVCYWQDDMSGERDYSSANRSTLIDYRLKYENNKDMSNEIYLKYYKI